MKIDFADRRFDGSVNGHAFSCYVDGTMSCGRVSGTVRDEMRLAAADAFLSSGRALSLTAAERAYWAKLRTVDGDHKAFIHD